MLAAVAGAHQFEHRKLRNGEALAAGLDDERRHDRERQRDFDGEGGCRRRRTDFRSTVPPICSILLRTTSMPTPRPEMLVTFAAVEKPGMKMKLQISDFRLGGELCLGGEAFLDGFGPDASKIEAAAVVA